MNKDYLIGLDIGNRSIRCIVVKVNSNQSIITRRSWRDRPIPGHSWTFDLDLNLAWKLIIECIQEALQRSQALPDQVSGLAITSVRHSTIVLDKNLNVLLSASGRDARSAGQSSNLGRLYGEELYKSTGHWPLPISHASRLSWLKETSQESFSHIAHVLGLCDWITLCLCGKYHSESTLAAESMLFDLYSNNWSEDWIDRLGFNKEWFPEIAHAGDCVGYLTSSAASELGLKTGIPVMMGCGDTQSALLGLGAIQPGDTAAILGSTAPLQRVIDMPWIDPSYRLWTSKHALPNLWVVESNAGSMGDALDWCSGLLFPESAQPVNRLLGEAYQATPGAGGILSSFGVQVFDAHQATAPVGHFTCNQFIGGTAVQRRANICRSVLEGMAYGLRANLEQMTTSKNKPSALYLAGGISQSRIFAQLLSDVIDIPVYAAVIQEASVLGAAICASVGAGHFSNLEDGVKQMASSFQSHQPDKNNSLLYNEKYQNWYDLQKTRSESDDLASNLLIEPMMQQLEEEASAGSTRFQPRFLVTAQMDETSLGELRQLGEVTYACYREEMRLLTGEELVSELQGYQVFITEVDVIDQESLQSLPELRLVVSCRGNAVNVDIPACSALGIPVLNAPGRNAQAVAELTLAFMFNLGRKLNQANQFLRQPGGEAGDMGRMGYAFNELIGQELWGKTIGLVGMGAVGQAVAQRLKPFQVHMLAYDPYITPEAAATYEVEMVDLGHLLSSSDYVSLHASVTPQTRGLIGADQLNMMKPGAFLINTARAALVDEDTLLDNLRSGHLAGAAIDVFSIEPPGSDHPLLTLPNVIATPHIGGNTREVGIHQSQIILADLRRILAGQTPINILNPETITSFKWEGARQALSLETVSLPANHFNPVVSDIERDSTTRTEEPVAQKNQPTELSGGKLEEAVTQSASASIKSLLDDKELPTMNTSTAYQGIRQDYERVIQTFIELASQDPALLAYAATHTVTTHYTVSDLGIQYYVGFAQGKVLSGFGAPPTKAEVCMKATAQTFDGIFTGQINGNKAAMSGKLSFSGDVRIAMGVQKIQNDLIRLYSQARQAAGGLPDLSNIPSALTLSKTPVQVAQGNSDLRSELVQSIQELFQMQLITATGGNLSVRIPETNHAWITPSQLYKGDLKPEVMVRIDLDGNAIDPDALAPSSERLLHTEIYKNRPDVQAIIHAHAPYTTILGLSDLPFLPVTADAAFIKELPRVPFIMPGTRELAEAVAKSLGENPAVIMLNHGVVVAASSLRRAGNLLEAIERSCQLILGSYAVGVKPQTLPKEVIKDLQEIGRMMA